jgi:hypothetical protein
VGASQKELRDQHSWNKEYDQRGRADSSIHPERKSEASEDLYFSTNQDKQGCQIRGDSSCDHLANGNRLVDKMRFIDCSSKAIGDSDVGEDGWSVVRYLS